MLSKKVERASCAFKLKCSFDGKWDVGADLVQLEGEVPMSGGAEDGRLETYGSHRRTNMHWRPDLIHQADAKRMEKRLRFIRLASFVVVVGICKLTEAYYTNPLGKNGKRAVFEIVSEKCWSL
ncbi:hypothetical protein GEV33_004796 [Tenebrio molitor]|uniref:Uncharacterized protein n=1 Tax=Tenebrio molitor TaxID=7067 RepID=A0A8J6HNR3_TENMO|nr:hypothetical protein GEV33_004796 [Tenebrio molitor]